MILFQRINDLRQHLQQIAKQGCETGFVPTMGALHAGHLSLLETALAKTDVTICSIFVNPTQFNDAVDFQKYPRTTESDIRMLEEAGCHILFLPAVPEIYPESTVASKSYDLGFLETVLEGRYRPGHFQGVCQVMDRLLQIIQPGHLFMGQKDYQQCMVVNRLLDLNGMASATRLHVCPTLRESDGLAMSSRNRRIATDDRAFAAGIYEALGFLKSHAGQSTPARLKEQATDMLVEKHFRPDYVEIADARTLSPIGQWKEGSKMVALIAAFLGEVRLIDNMELN